MNAALMASLGLVGIAVGLAGMFFTFGPALLADGPADERAVAVGAGLAMLAVTVAGGFALRRGIREKRDSA